MSTTQFPNNQYVHLQRVRETKYDFVNTEKEEAAAAAQQVIFSLALFSGSCFI